MRSLVKDVLFLTLASISFSCASLPANRDEYSLPRVSNQITIYEINIPDRNIAGQPIDWKVTVFGADSVEYNLTFLSPISICRGNWMVPYKTAIKPGVQEVKGALNDLLPGAYEFVITFSKIPRSGFGNRERVTARRRFFVSSSMTSNSPQFTPTLECRRI